MRNGEAHVENPAAPREESVEIRALIDVWSGSGATFETGRSIAACFEEQVARTPDRVAVVDGEMQLTYAKVNESANRVAHYLRRAGVGPEDVVGLFLERSIALLVGMLGIVKSGGAYLPIDPSTPRERTTFMLRDARASHVLTSAAAHGMLDAGAAQQVLLDVDWPRIAECDGANPALTADRDSLAYVIFTSGSTGVPKGCEITNASVLRLFAACQAWFQFGPDDVVAQFHSTAFDVSVFEIWSALLHGGRIVTIPYAVSRSPDELLDLIANERVTLLCQTPTAFRQLSAAACARPEMEPLALRRIILAGEALDFESLRPWIVRSGDTAPELINMYGPTEATVYATYRRVTLADLDAGRGSVIGIPLPDARIFILDAEQRPCTIGTPGELHIGGAGLARGYLRRDDLTAERFIRWRPEPGRTEQRLYRSGDLARWTNDGEVEYLGRMDQQIKIRGFRIEPGEIEAVLSRHPGVAACVVVAHQGPGREPRLVAYIVPRNAGMTHASLRAHLLSTVPPYMVPSAFVPVDALPINSNGKLDRHSLPSPERERPDIPTAYAAPIGRIEEACAATFAELLQLDRVGRNDNFFDLGGDSALAVQACSSLEAASGLSVTVATLFANASPATLASALIPGGPDRDRARRAGAARTEHAPEPIALIGMAVRLPGADSVEEFWDVLTSGRDTVTRFRMDQLDSTIPMSVRSDRAYVPARGVLRDAVGFDPAFFGMAQRDAEILDPQQRLLLELAWECLERAGYAPSETGESGQTVGVFAGVYSSDYARRHLHARPDLMAAVGEFAEMLATDKDYVATRIAHRLNLTGPAISVHTACSTSLVAIVQAVDSLRAGRCSMALAGGAAITYPTDSGHVYVEGAMLSKDGATRTFDASGTGTVFGDGGALVLLKRLADAVADGDHIHAVIRGAAINNDGGAKASFTAPSVDGQAAVIAAAHRDARVQPRSISYVEAHGTATPVGDPVEIEALTRAFRSGIHGTNDTGFCRIGSAKSNLGHMVTAAGAVGLIKAALSLEHELIPATLHYTAPNQAIDFQRSPFVVNAEPTQWPRSELPRRAGVSAFGVGGTNAHVVLEDAPRHVPAPAAPGPSVLRLSARTQSSLVNSVAAVAAHLRHDTNVDLNDVAFTLHHGRSAFTHRLCVVAHDAAGAAEALADAGHALRSTRIAPSARPDVIFMFPGQGAQYPAMGADLYASHTVFRDACDEVFAALHDITESDLKSRMFSGDPESLLATSVTQPATFCLEYALSKLWLSQGVTPTAMIGHSVGEFVAAVLAGVMTLDDAARLVARRGALMNAMPGGCMLSVLQSAEALSLRLPSAIALAAVNGPASCVVSGPRDAIDALVIALDEDGVLNRRLPTSHAFHSSMMDPVLCPFAALVREVRLSAPRIPVISTLTGTWLTAAEATDPTYWTRHLRETVQFGAAVRTALAGEPALFLEVGPRHTLSTLVKQQRSTWPGEAVPPTVATLTDGPMAECEAFALAVGQLWLHRIDAEATSDTGRRRVPLPTYQFDRITCRIDVAPVAHGPMDDSDTRESSLAPRPGHERSVEASQGAGVFTAPSRISIQAPPRRRDRLRSQLTAIFEVVGGIELDGTDSAASFIELGLDSLVLTQATIQVRRCFSTDITFRQLMEQFRSIDSLAEYLDTQLAPDAEAVSPHPGGPPEQASSTACADAKLRPRDEASPGFAGRVICQQPGIMQPQLTLLSSPISAVKGPDTAPCAANGIVPLNGDTRAATAAGPMTTERAEEDTVSALAHTQYDVSKAFGAIARIHTRHATDLSARQRLRLDAFIRRYVARTAQSKAYTEEHRPHLADPRVVSGFRPLTKEICYQIVIERSKGSRMWDLDGNEYVDVLCGFGMNLFGWQPAFVHEAVKEQLEIGHDIGPQHPLTGDVARLICELTGFDRAGLCNTGSEAVMGAIRIARTVTARTLIVSFTGSYHGVFDEALVRGTKQHRAVPAAPGVMHSSVENVLVLDYGTQESLEIIRSRAHEIAAVLVEPVQSRRPEFQPVEFLKELRRITEESGTVLVFDEVITGFRAHPRGAQGLFGITADLATYGKVIGGGYPIGVIAGKRRFMDALDGGAWRFGDDSLPTVGVTYFAGTFVRHPLALAACKAVLLHVREQGPALQASLNARTSAMVLEMNVFARACGAPLEIRHFASLWRVTFTEEHPLQDLLWAMMRNRGVHVLDNFPCFLTTAHSDADIAQIIAVFKAALAEMLASGFLPGTIPEAASTMVSTEAPAPNARLGRDRDGAPAWFVPDPETPGQYLKLMA